MQSRCSSRRTITTHMAAALFAASILSVPDGAIAAEPGERRQRPTLSGPCYYATTPADSPAHPPWVGGRWEEFDRLARALVGYDHILRRGGWPSLPERTLLRPGEPISAELANRLRTRLVLTGDLDEAHAAVPAARYDGALVDAVQRFQVRHGLLVDGIVGPETVRTMNVPAAIRVRQIALNMERMCRLPVDPGERHVRVNIPEFRLRLLDGGDEVLALRVVVGARHTPTPVFSDDIEYLQFRPYWNVPDSIARHELVPRALEDPEYLQRHGFEVLAGWQPGAAILDPAAIDWRADTSAAYRIRQRPGPANALGLVKFMFPNRHSVYVHDTSARQLLTRRYRAFSHGCVRVEAPERLATALLAPQGWTADDVRSAMHASSRLAVALEEPVPIHLVYLTAWVDDDGVVQFRPDVYGRDAEAFGLP